MDADCKSMTVKKLRAAPKEIRLISVTLVESLLIIQSVLTKLKKRHNQPTKNQKHVTNRVGNQIVREKETMKDWETKVFINLRRFWLIRIFSKVHKSHLPKK